MSFEHPLGRFGHAPEFDFKRTESGTEGTIVFPHRHPHEPPIIHEVTGSDIIAGAILLTLLVVAFS